MLMGFDPECVFNSHHFHQIHNSIARNEKEKKMEQCLSTRGGWD
jgi:hypothetical protein